MVVSSVLSYEEVGESKMPVTLVKMVIIIKIKYTNLKRHFTVNVILWEFFLAIFNLQYCDTLKLVTRNQTSQIYQFGEFQVGKNNSKENRKMKKNKNDSLVRLHKTFSFGVNKLTGSCQGNRSTIKITIWMSLQKKK